MNKEQLQAQLSQLENEFTAHKAAGLNLDLTRGKPSVEQLELSASLDGILNGNYLASDNTDARGYGGLDGLPEAKAIGAALTGLTPDQVIVGGNSSLNLMYLYMMHCMNYGPGIGGGPWRDSEQPQRFICPVPGYDRHFSICEDLGLEMINVTMTETGPDMDQVEALVAKDPGIKGIWCVPKYSNPGGEIYSPETVRRIAGLATIAGSGFQVMWDNAYAVHHLGDEYALTDIMPIAEQFGSADSIVVFGSTSKITFAGAGLAFIGGSKATLGSFRERLSMLTIGPDKVNQLRHVHLLKDLDGIRELMLKHKAILKPKFDTVQQVLKEGLGDSDMARWTNPAGGYFVSVDVHPGLATKVIALAAEAGVKLTQAGCAYPYGNDPDDANIRLAPSYPPLEEVTQAMKVFTTCVKLASTQLKISG